MANLLGTLHSAASGMSASQTAIQTTSHNISNINTPGYTRQRVEQSASRPYSQPGYNSKLGAGQFGTGVQVNNVIRIRNSFYDYQFRSESHNYGSTSVKYDYYTNLENIFNEPSDTSISSALNKFFNGFHDLSKDPNSSGTKNIVVENAKYLSNALNQVYKNIDNLQDTSNSQKDSILNEINGMLESLKELDKNIKVIEGNGKSPNDMLDERDKILDELSFKIDLNNEKVKKAISDGKLELTELQGADGKLDASISGELAGIISMENETESYKKSLGQLMDGLAEGVNDIYNKDGNTGGIFEVKKDDENNTISISVKEELINDPNKLSVTSDKALELYNLKDKKIEIGENGNKTSITINNFYNGMVQKLGHATEEIIRVEKNQSKLLKSIDNSRLSVSGVSMDEEFVNLMQLQHAYSASAKVISTIDSLLDVVVNGLIR